MESARRNKSVVLAALAAALVAAAPAQASDDCEAPVERWQSREAVRQMAAEQGWDVERLKIDDGCYEIRGTDAKGRRFKAKIDPETLQVIKLKQRGDRDHDRKRDRGYDGERYRDRDSDRNSDRNRGRQRDPAAQAASPAESTPSSPLFTPGTAPRGQVE